MLKRMLLPVLAAATILAGVAIQPAASATPDARDQYPVSAVTRSSDSPSEETQRLDDSSARRDAEASNCQEAKARAERVAGAARPYGCITQLSPATPKGSLGRISTPGARTGVSALADVPLPVNDCTGDEDGSWYSTRTMQCQIYPNVQYSYFDSNHKPLGNALFATAQQLDLFTNSLQWTETDQITMVEANGTLPADLTISWTTNCSATCSPGTTMVWPTTRISLGQSLKKTYTLTDQPTTVLDYIDLDYSLAIDSASSVDLTPPIKWGGAKVRCDNKISVGDKAGCVVPWYTPTLRVSRSQYGSSAAMIEWAQNNLSGHWGLRGIGEPLHRLQSDSQQRSNRRAICGTTKFTSDPNIQDDSCDEFPFAGTYESGALNGVDHGKDCAQVTAVQAGTSGELAIDWPTVTPVGTVTGSEKCVRGHIPSSLNTNLGGAYGVFIKDVLLADDDPFWLSVTS